MRGCWLLRTLHVAVFSPDGKRLLTNGTRGLLEWDVSADVPSPTEVDVYLKRRSPWRVVDGELRPLGSRERELAVQ